MELEINKIYKSVSSPNTFRKVISIDGTMVKCFSVNFEHNSSQFDEVPSDIFKYLHQICGDVNNLIEHIEGHRKIIQELE